MKHAIFFISSIVLVQCVYYQRVKGEYYQGVKRDLEKLTDEELEALFQEVLKKIPVKSGIQNNLKRNSKNEIDNQKEKYSSQKDGNEKQRTYISSDELQDINNMKRFKPPDNGVKKEVYQSDNLKKSFNINIYLKNEKDGQNKVLSNWPFDLQPRNPSNGHVTDGQKPTPDEGNQNVASPKHPHGITGSSNTNTVGEINSGVGEQIIAPPPLTRDDAQHFHNDQSSKIVSVKLPELNNDKNEYMNSANKKTTDVVSSEYDENNDYSVLEDRLNDDDNDGDDNDDGDDDADDDERLNIFAKSLDHSYNIDNAEYKKSYNYIKDELKKLDGNVIRTLLNIELDNKEHDESNSKLYSTYSKKSSSNKHDENHVDRTKTTTHGKGGKNMLQNGKEIAKTGLSNLKTELKNTNDNEDFVNKINDNIFDNIVPKSKTKTNKAFTKKAIPLKDFDQSEFSQKELNELLYKGTNKNLDKDISKNSIRRKSMENETTDDDKFKEIFNKAIQKELDDVQKIQNKKASKRIVNEQKKETLQIQNGGDLTRKKDMIKKEIYYSIRKELNDEIMSQKRIENMKDNYKKQYENTTKREAPLGSISEAELNKVLKSFLLNEIDDQKQVHGKFEDLTAAPAKQKAPWDNLSKQELDKLLNSFLMNEVDDLELDKINQNFPKKNSKNSFIKKLTRKELDNLLYEALNTEINDCSNIATYNDLDGNDGLLYSNNLNNVRGVNNSNKEDKNQNEDSERHLELEKFKSKDYRKDGDLKEESNEESDDDSADESDDELSLDAYSEIDENEKEMKMYEQPFNKVAQNIKRGKVPGQNIRLAFEMKECRFAHNKLRLLHQVKRMEWNEELAYGSEQWALHLAMNNNGAQHSSFYDKKGRKYGENLYWYRGSELKHCNDAVYLWYQENEGFDQGKSKNLFASGHFVQLVWGETRHVGVGIAFAHDQTWIVARYFPAQNTAVKAIGEYVKPSLHAEAKVDPNDLVSVKKWPTLMSPVQVTDHPVTDCSDKNQQCSYWNKRGYCHPRFKFMKQECPKLCGFCHPGHPVNGEWTSWVKTSPCTTDCGVGTKIEHRYCSNPQPANGGNSCKGSWTRKQQCRENTCQSKYINCLDKHRDCVGYAKKGYCLDKKWKRWMTKNCYSSCGICNSCHDNFDNDKCADYTVKLKLCPQPKYIPYMTKNCQMFCCEYNRFFLTSGEALFNKITKGKK